MDYTREDCCFPVQEVAWRFQTPNRFPAVIQGLILEEEAEKNTDRNELNVRKPLVVSISQKKGRAETPQLVLEFDHVKPPA